MDDLNLNDGQEDFQAAQARLKTALPYLVLIDQLLRDHPGLLLSPLEDMDEHEGEVFKMKFSRLCFIISARTSPRPI
jgi:hypothetical protein